MTIPTPDESGERELSDLEMLRNGGWSVAVHNDFRLGGRRWTFWLFTHPSGVWAKGEGPNDEQAVNEARQQANERLRRSTDTRAEVLEQCEQIAWDEAEKQLAQFDAGTRTFGHHAAEFIAKYIRALKANTPPPREGE